ncbi:FtsX-like permease family protein [Flavobacteriaceae bacterium]|jgi:lipoprotein-releasing system permease protein|nr:ABC transporter permease [Flavobacteriaceae bacterium]MDA7736413.1 FtsX-like permease family protein [Flavobacteriaceae bacterium]MDA7765050.1 FtsX-like permease family protein [Flavobacteriaceae bacterium]MDA9226189.1 FtsX-like permease family protein [Flavobacteriaceae bacterium]MDA9577312.1 FtsX-like permease family protein [Flavobacteriaceae bacterium]
MTYSLKIALRYFFSKSQQTVINRINGFALFMVVVATAALFIVLSAFAGLKDFGLSFTNSFDPDFEIQAIQGKYLTLENNTLSQIEALEQIDAAAPEIEEKVFLSFKEKNQVAYLKAVGPRYINVVEVDQLIALGDWLSFSGSEAVLGFGIAGSLSVGVFDYNTFLNVTVPKKNQKSLLGQDPFVTMPSVVVGLYQISEDLDKKYVFSNLEFGQKLLELEANQYSSLVIKTKGAVNKEVLLPLLSPFFKEPIRLVSRSEQNAALYKMLNVEHLAIYFIFTLVMIIALFNVVGALIMMILDKKGQLKILLAMGAQPRGIHQIFFTIGLLICGVGGIIGLVIGVLIVILQDHFPFIYVPGTSLAYPVLFELKNIAIVLGTLLILGTISTAWATRGLVKKVKAYAIS